MRLYCILGAFHCVLASLFRVLLVMFVLAGRAVAATSWQSLVILPLAVNALRAVLGERTRRVSSLGIAIGWPSLVCRGMRHFARRVIRPGDQVSLCSASTGTAKGLGQA
jgi:hypothetical protein